MSELPKVCDIVSQRRSLQDIKKSTVLLSVQKFLQAVSQKFEWSSSTPEKAESKRLEQLTQVTRLMIQNLVVIVAFTSLAVYHNDLFLRNIIVEHAKEDDETVMTIHFETSDKAEFKVWPAIMIVPSENIPSEKPDGYVAFIDAKPLRVKVVDWGFATSFNENIPALPSIGVGNDFLQTQIASTRSLDTPFAAMFFKPNLRPVKNPDIYAFGFNLLHLYSRVDPKYSNVVRQTMDPIEYEVRGKYNVHRALYLLFERMVRDETEKASFLENLRDHPQQEEYERLWGKMLAQLSVSFYLRNSHLTRSELRKLQYSDLLPFVYDWKSEQLSWKDTNEVIPSDHINRKMVYVLFDVNFLLFLLYFYTLPFTQSILSAMSAWIPLQTTAAEQKKFYAFMSKVWSWKDEPTNLPHHLLDDPWMHTQILASYNA